MRYALIGDALPTPEKCWTTARLPAGTVNGFMRLHLVVSSGFVATAIFFVNASLAPSDSRPVTVIGSALLTSTGTTELVILVCTGLVAGLTTVTGFTCA